MKCVLVDSCYDVCMYIYITWCRICPNYCKLGKIDSFHSLRLIFGKCWCYLAYIMHYLCIVSNYQVMFRNFAHNMVLELLINWTLVVGQPWPSTHHFHNTACPVPSATSLEPNLILPQDLQSPVDLVISEALLLETSTFSLTCQETSTFSLTCQFSFGHMSDMYHLAWSPVVGDFHMFVTCHFPLLACVLHDHLPSHHTTFCVPAFFLLNALFSDYSLSCTYYGGSLIKPKFSLMRKPWASGNGEEIRGQKIESFVGCGESTVEYNGGRFWGGRDKRRWAGIFHEWCQIVVDDLSTTVMRELETDELMWNFWRRINQKETEEAWQLLQLMP